MSGGSSNSFSRPFERPFQCERAGSILQMLLLPVLLYPDLVVALALHFLSLVWLVFGTTAKGKGSSITLLYFKEEEHFR